MPSIPGLSRAQARRMFVGKPPTRVAAQPLTAPNATKAASAQDVTQRELHRFPFAVPRWRIGFRNMQMRSSTIPTTPCAITGVWVGPPAYATTSTSGNRWVGDFAVSPTQVCGSLTVPVDGSRVWSDWITTAPWETNAERVLSWGMTSTNSGTGIAGGNSTQGVKRAGASNASATTLTGQTVGNDQVYLDVVIEYEYAESVQSGLFIGDSNTLSYMASAPQGISAGQAGCAMCESWPALAGAMGGFAATNLGVGSTTMLNWDPTNASTASADATYFPQLWDRIPTAAQYEFAVVSLGTNNLGAGLTPFVAQVQNIDAKIRSMGIDTIWWTTITPRCYPDGAYTSGGTPLAGYLAANAAAGATSISVTTPLVAGTTLVGLATTMEDVTVTSVAGSGPYTLSISGGLASAHYAGEPVSQGNERLRRYFNAHLRNLPDGIAGCIDFERLVERTPQAYDCDARLVCSDYLHFHRGANIEKARAVVSAGVQPLFA